MNPDAAIELATRMGRAADAYAELCRGLATVADDLTRALREPDPLATGFGGDPLDGLRRAARAADDLHRICREARDVMIGGYLDNTDTPPRQWDAHRPGPGFYVPPGGQAGTRMLPPERRTGQSPR